MARRADEIEQGIHSGEIDLIPRDKIFGASPADLSPFQGGQGKLAFDPITGQKIKAKDRVKPQNFIGKQAPRNIDPTAFEFSNLPGIGTNQATAGLRGAGRQALTRGGEAIGQGGQAIGQGRGILGSVLGQSGAQVGSRAGLEAGGRQQFRGQQQGALDPRLGAGSQEFISRGLSQRLSDVDRLFGEGGAAREGLAKNLANEIADLDALGVSGSGEASVISNLLGNFQRDRFAAQSGAREATRAEELNERQRAQQAAGQAAGQSLQDVLSQGQLQAQLLGLGGDIGKGIGQLGLGQQQVGTDLSKLGVSAIDQALGRDLQHRGQEAELQQGQRAFNTNLLQQFIDNRRLQQQIRRGQTTQNVLLDQLGVTI